MRLGKFLLFCLTLLLPFTGVDSSQADAIDCARSSVGQIVVWRSAWQNDNQDEGVRYKVKRVLSTLRSSEGVRLEIQALGNAAKVQRMVEINSPSVAHLFCSALQRRKLSIPESPGAGLTASLPIARPNSPVVAQSEINKLPYIHFGDTGWVRADMPKNVELSVCRISHMRFSCSSSDKARHAPYLKSIEEELRTLP